MMNILTNDIEANSFMGLITDQQKKSRKIKFDRKIFVNVESKEVLRNLTVAIVVIVLGLTIGTISQQKMEFAQYSTPVTTAAV
ncbi:MAG: hypothetical protein JKY45_00705 [Emcibacter sp.]|nr:hypothetical protein [Emcibacter sp.]